MTGFITVPRSWRGYLVEGQPLSGEGYATYRLSILLDPNLRAGQLLAINMPVPINTAYRLYIDGRLVGSAGQVGPSGERMTPQYNPQIVVFAPTGEQVEVLLHISNFHHYLGGVIQPIEFGTQRQIQQRDGELLARDLFLIGASAIIGLYHLGLFTLRRRNRSVLFFGLFCLAVAWGTLITRQPQIFFNILSQSWVAYFRTRLIAAIVSPSLLTLFVQSVFLQLAPKRFHWLLYGLGVTVASLILVTPTEFSTRLVTPVSIFGLALVVYNFGLIIVAVVYKANRAGILLLAYLPFLLASLNDVLYINGLLQTGFFIPIGLFILILGQAYLLASEYAESYHQIKSLSSELQHNFDLLQAAQDKLRVSENKYRNIFDDSKDLIFITALDGQVEAINPACFDMLGYTQAEALNLNATDFYAHPTERLRFQEAIAQTGAVTDFPVIVRRKDGQDLECQLTATVRLDPLGQPMGYQGILHDLTAYKQAEAHRQRVWALQDLNQSLEQRVEDRTLALTQASAALQTEIEQRQSHQQEKERLLALAQQQSEHLRAMSKALLEIQQAKHHNQAAGLDEDLRQKMADLRQNLTALQAMAGFEQNLNLVAYVSDTTRLLAEVEIYVEQVTVVFDEANPSIDPMVGNPLLQLSGRERQVLKLMAEGKSNPEIANLLTIRLNTVHTYLKRIRNKLDIQDTPGLINFARNNGLLK